MRSSSAWTRLASARSTKAGDHEGAWFWTTATTVASWVLSQAAVRNVVTSTSAWCDPSATTSPSRRPSTGATSVARTRCPMTDSATALTSSSRSTSIAPRSMVASSSVTRRAWSGPAQPAAEPGCDVDVDQPAAYDLRREEVVTDEVTEAGAQGVLAGRDQGRVRDREPERASEQRGDGEPVGETADHARLGRSGDVPGPGGAVVDGRLHEHEDGGRDEQEAGGEGLRPAEPGLSMEVCRGEGKGCGHGEHPARCARVGGSEPAESLLLWAGAGGRRR